MICFLDLDGVIVDFMKGAHDFYNIPYSIDKYPYELGNYETCPPISLGMRSQEFWNSFNEDFWVTLEWMHDGRKIVEYIESIFGQDNVCILTTPTPNPRSCSGKLMWIQKNLPQYSRQFFIGPPKSFCAHSNSMLVDDSDKNINYFNKHGGTGILVPQPWNSRYNKRHVSTSTIINEIDNIYKNNKG